MLAQRSAAPCKYDACACTASVTSQLSPSTCFQNHRYEQPLPGSPGLPLLTVLKLSYRDNSRNWRLPCWLHFRMNIVSQKSWPISSRCSHKSIWPKMFHNEMNCCFTVITEWKFTIPVIHLDHNTSKLFENVKCSGSAKCYRYANSSSVCVRLFVSSLQRDFYWLTQESMSSPQITHISLPKVSSVSDLTRFKSRWIL